MVNAGDLLSGSQASTGVGSSPEPDNIDAIIALIKLIQVKGCCSAFKACDDLLISEIATVFTEVGLQGIGKACIEEVLDCVSISDFDLTKCRRKVLITQAISQIIKLANEPNRPCETQDKVATNLEKLVSTLNKEKEVVHIDIQKELMNNCGNWHKHSKGLWPMPSVLDNFAADISKQKKLQLNDLFVAIDAVKFLPPWCTEQHKAGTLIKSPSLLNASLSRWAHAGQAAGIFPLAAGYSHIDNCNRATAEAFMRKKTDASLAGAIYNREKQNEIEQNALRNLSCDIANELTNFDRDLLHKVCDMLESDGQPKTKGTGKGDYKSGQKDKGTGSWGTQGSQSSSSYQAKELYQSHSQSQKRKWGGGHSHQDSSWKKKQYKGGKW